MGAKGMTAVAVALAIGVIAWAGRDDAALDRPLSAAQAALLASVEPGEVLMYCSESCPECEHARRWLDRHQVSYTACHVETDRTCEAEAQALGVEATPYFVLRHTAQPRRLVGWDPAEFMAALAD